MPNATEPNNTNNQASWLTATMADAAGDDDITVPQPTESQGWRTNPEIRPRPSVMHSSSSSPPLEMNEIELVYHRSNTNNHSGGGEHHHHCHSITDLDPYTLIQVISYLDKRDVLSLSETCRQLMLTTSQNLIWNHFLRREQLMTVYSNRHLLEMSDDHGDSPQFGIGAANSSNHWNNKSGLMSRGAWLAVSHWPSMVRLRPFLTSTSSVPKHIAEAMYMRQYYKNRVNVKRCFVEISFRRYVHEQKERLLLQYDGTPTNVLAKYGFWNWGIPMISWLCYLLLALYSLLYLLVLFPLCLDRYVVTPKSSNSNNVYTWLIPYLPPTIIICVPYLALLLVQSMYHDYVPIVTRREFDYWLSYVCWKPAPPPADDTVRDDGPPSWMGQQLMLSLPTCFLFIPLFTLLLGIKIGLLGQVSTATATNFKSIYIVIPTIVAQWLFVPKVIISANGLQKPHHWTGLVLVTGWVLAWFLLSLGMLFTALKVDRILPPSYLYSYVFIFYHLAIVLTGVAYCITVKLVSSTWKTHRLTNILSIILMPIVLMPIFASVLLCGFVMDRIVAMPYIAAFSPVIGLTFIASIITTIIVPLCIALFVWLTIKHHGESPTSDDRE